MFLKKTIYIDYKYNKILHLWNKKKKKAIFILAVHFNLGQQKSFYDQMIK